MVQAIFSDLDGTLINNQNNVSKENKEAIHSFVNKKGFFSIATGRSEISIQSYIADLPINMPLIIYNGAAVYDFSQKKFLRKKWLDNVFVQDILRFIISIYPKVCAEVFMGGPVCFVNRKGVMDPYILQSKELYKLVDIDNCKDCFKLLFYGEPNKLKKVMKAVKREYSEKMFSSTFSTPFYLEILPMGVSKDTGIQWILQNNLYNVSKYCAIGDYDNDVEMICNATLGAAPLNSSDEVKKVADVIVRSNDHHSLADLIYNHVL